ncbi:hypothetical protein ACETU7_28080 [Rhodococcus sp. 3Y1]
MPRPRAATARPTGRLGKFPLPTSGQLVQQLFAVEDHRRRISRAPQDLGLILVNFALRSQQPDEAQQRIAVPDRHPDPAKGQP